MGVAQSYYWTLLLSTHKKARPESLQAGLFLITQASERRVIDIPLRARTIERLKARLIERRILLQSLHQVRVGDKGHAEANGIGLAFCQPGIALFLGEAFVGDQRAAELLLELRGQAVVAGVFAGE